MTQTLNDTCAPDDFGAAIAAPVDLSVIRRDGSTAPFDAGRIIVAITKAFLAVEGEKAQTSSRLRSLVSELTGDVVATLHRRHAPGGKVNLEDVQDQVELVLMRGGHAAVARLQPVPRGTPPARAERDTTEAPAVSAGLFSVVALDGSVAPLDRARLSLVIGEACTGLGEVDPATVLAGTESNLYDGMSTVELGLAPIMAARGLVETEPAYSTVAARLLADTLRSEALTFLDGSPRQATAAEMTAGYANYLPRHLAAGSSWDSWIRSWPSST